MRILFENYLRLLICFFILSFSNDFPEKQQYTGLIIQELVSLEFEDHPDWFKNSALSSYRYTSDYRWIIKIGYPDRVSTSSFQSAAQPVSEGLLVNPNEPMSIVFKPWEIVTAISWSMDGQYIQISAGNSIYLYEVNPLNQIGRIELGTFTHTLGFNESGEYFSAGSRDGHIRVWIFDQLINDLLIGNIPDTHWDVEAHKKGVTKLLFNSEDNSIISAGKDRITKIWDINSGEIKSELIGGKNSIPGIALDPFLRKIAILNGDYIRIRDYETTLIWGTIRSPDFLFDITYTPDGGNLISSGVSNNIYIWNPDLAFRTGVEEYPEPLVLTGHNGEPGTYHALVWDVEVDPSGDYFVSAGGDGQVIFWDIQTKQPFQVISDNKNAVTCLAFNPVGNKLAVGQINGILKIWSLTE